MIGVRGRENGEKGEKRAGATNFGTSAMTLRLAESCGISDGKS
jgi:hypothetical protein